MLNLSRLNYFRYDAREALKSAGIEPKVGKPLLASVVSKASRVGIADAKDYVREKDDDGTLPENCARELVSLLDRYKKWR